MLRFLLLLASCGLLVGCSTLESHREKKLPAIKRIYVEHLLTDNYRTDFAIVEELKQLGYEASCGPITMMPDGVDAIITYQQRSAWDFRSYLIEISLVLKANFSGDVLATSHFYQPSLRTRTPEEAVHTVVTALIPKR